MKEYITQFVYSTKGISYLNTISFIIVLVFGIITLFLFFLRFFLLNNPKFIENTYNITPEMLEKYMTKANNKKTTVSNSKVTQEVNKVKVTKEVGKKKNITLKKGKVDVATVLQKYDKTRQVYRRIEADGQYHYYQMNDQNQPYEVQYTP